MRHITMKTALIAAALLLACSLSIAADSIPAAPAAAKSPGNTATPGAKAKAPATKPKLVDINSASKTELMKLRGIGDAEADRVIAGRPYLSKSHLVTHMVLPQGIYEQIKNQIVAVQKPEYVKQQASPEAKK